MRKLLAALCLLALPALAGEANLSWTAPTQNVDGTPLTNLTGYRLYSRCTPTGPFLLAATVPAPATTTTLGGLPDGTTCFFVATAYNPNGESAYSNQASKLFPVVPVPQPPAQLTVAADTAYTLVQSIDRLALVPVGTVPVGTPCDVAQYINGRFVVPKDAVTWYGSVRSEVVVASCQ